MDGLKRQFESSSDDGGSNSNASGAKKQKKTSPTNPAISSFKTALLHMAVLCEYVAIKPTHASETQLTEIHTALKNSIESLESSEQRLNEKIQANYDVYQGHAHIEKNSPYKKNPAEKNTEMSKDVDVVVEKFVDEFTKFIQFVDETIESIAPRTISKWHALERTFSSHMKRLKEIRKRIEDVIATRTATVPSGPAKPNPSISSSTSE